jgi:hypothetical protein
MKKTARWFKLGGKGKIGSSNWGYHEPQDDLEAEEWLKNCQEQIGNTVVLSGGGSLMNEMHAAILDKAEFAMCGDHKTVRVCLSNIKPTFSEIDNCFDPFLGSWQLSVIVDDNGNNITHKQLKPEYKPQGVNL